MIELAQHIEYLLLENDCVIVPGLGGFVAHYVSSARVAKDNTFFPPTRVIGFNPQLNMNDGLLVQSYMSVYGTNFSDATKMVERKVNELIAELHEDGKVELPNVGEVSYNINGTLGFAPFDNKITSPCLYGLDVFEMKELAELRRPQTENVISQVERSEESKQKSTVHIKFNKSYLINAAAVVAAVVISFFFSTPIKNTEVVKENYAKLLPAEMFEKIEMQSIAISPIVVKQNKPISEVANTKKETQKIVPIVAKEVKVAKINEEPDYKEKKQAQANNANETGNDIKSPTVRVEQKEQSTESSAPITVDVEAKTIGVASSKAYHIIIASVGTQKDAEYMATQLVDKGFAGAKAIIGGGKNRVGIESHNTEVEAYRALERVRQNDNYKNAWVLKK